MKVSVKVSGFRELEKALSLLPKAAAKSTLVRVAKKAGQPIADLASGLAPKLTGELSSSIRVGTRVANSVGKKDYAEVMRSGGTRAAARTALLSARSGNAGGSFAIAYVGPEKAKTKSDAIKRIVQEFGSSKMPPSPYMRPAWDAKKMEAFDIIRNELASEIIATAKRIGKSRSLRYTDAIKSEASMAALMAHELGG